uniref:Ig-like domain-containing protein n=1 Tax=Anopheles farauti TaxID=69004 RepID=A0A182R063_9DIPT
MGRGEHVLRDRNHLISSSKGKLLLIATIVLLSLNVALTEALGCPPKCSCQQRTVRCVKQQLDKVPEMPPDTSIIRALKLTLRTAPEPETDIVRKCIPRSTAAPRIVLGPENQNVQIGSTLTLECEADGNPLPHIWWKKDGLPVNETNQVYFTDDAIELTIDHVQESDSALECLPSCPITPRTCLSFRFRSSDGRCGSKIALEGAA